MIEPILVSGPLDAKIWFQLKDKMPEFLYADLCMTPPWESSTYQSTTTNGQFSSVFILGKYESHE